MSAKKTPKGQEFEKLIQRIHSILEPNGTTVEWNVKVPDPDLPESRRQIDIHINYPSGKSKYIECRDRSKVQDVEWIESLIGKKSSLKLSSVIGVSNSGFSKLALIKAKAHEIELFSVKSLTNGKIQSWKPKTVCFLAICQIKDMTINIKPELISHSEEFYSSIIDGFKSTPFLGNSINTFLNSYYCNHSFKRDQTNSQNFFLHLDTKNVLICHGVKILHLNIQAHLEQYEIEVGVSDKRLYLDNQEDTKAQIDTFETGIELIRSSDAATTTLRLKNLKLPKNHQWTGQIFMGMGEEHIMGSINYDFDYRPKMPDIKFSVI